MVLAIFLMLRPLPDRPVSPQQVGLAFEVPLRETSLPVVVVAGVSGGGRTMRKRTQVRVGWFLVACGLFLMASQAYLIFFHPEILLPWSAPWGLPPRFIAAPIFMMGFSALMAGVVVLILASVDRGRHGGTRGLS